MSFLSGKFSSYITIDDENETEIDVTVEYDGHADRGDNWTPPSTEMNIHTVEPSSGGLPDNVTNEQFATAVKKATDRLTEAAWDWEGTR